MVGESVSGCGATDATAVAVVDSTVDATDDATGLKLQTRSRSSEAGWSEEARASG